MARVTSEAIQALALESGRLRAQLNIVDVSGRNVIMSTRAAVGKYPRLDIVSGKVSTDESREIPGQGSVTVLLDGVSAETVVPDSVAHPMSPLARARVQIYYHAGSDPYTLRTPYGMYDIAKVNLDEDSDGLYMRLEFYDLARRIQRARFAEPWLVLSGTSYEQGLINLLIGVVEEDDISYTPTAKKSRSHWVYEPQDDRLAAIQTVATSVGYRLDFNDDSRGQLGFHPDTSQTADPVWTFEDGGNCRVTSLGRELSDEKSYNGVAVYGKAPGSDTMPPRWVVWDSNPNSLTYYDPAVPEASAYGPVPFFYQSDKITTRKQARDAARARLPKVLGLTERLSISAVPNPGIEVADPVRVVRPTIGVSGTYVIESIEMPLKGSDGRMLITCRERRLFE